MTAPGRAIFVPKHLFGDFFMSGGEYKHEKGDMSETHSKR